MNEDAATCEEQREEGGEAREVRQETSRQTSAIRHQTSQTELANQSIRYGT